MKTSVWTTVLLTLVFAIGWTSRTLADRSPDPVEEVVAGGEPEFPHSRDGSGSRDRDGRWDRDGRGGDGPDRSRRGPPGRSRGPWSSNLHRFADELGVDADQEAAMELVMDETREEVNALEREIWQAVERGRQRMIEVLRDDQRELLASLVEQERDEFRQADIAQNLKWMEEELALDTEQLQSAEGVLREYHDRVAAAFQSAFEGEQSDHKKWMVDFETHRKELYAALEPILGADGLEKYRSRSHWMRRGHHRDGGREDDDTRRDGERWRPSWDGGGRR